MSEDDPNSNKILHEYDDGVVCFGPITESQLERYQRLPRHTVLPSDIKLSLSTTLDAVEEKSDGNDSSNTNISQLINNIGEEETGATEISNNISYSSNTNITQLINNIGEEETGATGISNNISYSSNTNKTQLINNIGEEEIGASEMSRNISSVFSSPYESKYVPTGKLMNTEVFNRYIRMGSVSSDESFTESRNTSTSDAEDIGSFDDHQKDELTPINSNCNDTSLCGQLSVSSVIEQNISFPKGNICKLTHFSQQDDSDVSICSDSVLDICEDSIVPDEYIVTPGKQRIFDLRHVKSSFRAKTLVASAPSMDRIEETPVIPKILNSPLILENEVKYTPSESENNWDVSSATNLSQNESSVNVNQILSDCELESKKIFGESEKRNLCLSECETMDISPCSEYYKYTAPECVIENCIDSNKNSVMNIENMSTNNSIIENESINNEINSFYNNVVDLETSANIVSPTIQGNDYDKRVIEIEHINVEDKDTNETLPFKLLQMSDFMDLNETNQTKYVSNCMKEFDLDMTLNINENETLQYGINNTLNNLGNVDASYFKSNEPTDLNEMIAASNSTSQESSPEKNSLDFEQVIIKSNDNSLPSCGNIEMNESKNNQTQVNISIVDQTLISDELGSITDSISPVRSNLSVILENRTLEEDACNVAPSNNFENHNRPSEDIANDNHDVKTLNSSNTQNKFEFITNIVPSFSEVKPSMPNETDGEREINSNDNLINNGINYSKLTSVDNIPNITLNTINSSTICIDDSILSDGLIKTKPSALTEIENQSYDKTSESTLIIENIEKMLLNSSTHYTNNLDQTSRQKNSTDNTNFIAMKLISETENCSDEKQCVLLSNDGQEQSLLGVSENILESNNDKEQHESLNNDVQEQRLLELSENILESKNDEQNVLLNNDVQEQNLLELSENILESNNDKEQHKSLNNDVQEQRLLELSENILESNNDEEQNVSLNNDIQEQSLLGVSENILESNNDEEQNVSLINDIQEQSSLGVSVKILESNNDEEQNESLNNDVQEQSLLGVSENIFGSNNEVHDVIEFKENKRVQQFEYNSPKTQKLVDFSIVQQTPTIPSQSNNQKVLNFSIVDRTPISKNMLLTSLNVDSIKTDALIDFSTVDHMGDPEVSFNEDDSKVLQNNSKDLFFNNLSTISNPYVELLSDVSLKADSSSSSNLTMIHTTINTDLNLSSNTCKIYSTEINSDYYNKETIIDLESVDKDEHSNSLNKTNELNEYVNQSNKIEEIKFKTEILSNNSLDQKSEEVEATESNVDSNQQSINNLNNYLIMDSSINEQQGLQNYELKTNENIIEIECNEQEFLSIENSAMDETPMNKSNTYNKMSDDISIATEFEKSKLLRDTKFLTNIQMEDVSLLTDSSEISSINETFHSIESENIQKDNKRKIETVQEYNMDIKKMKIETEKLKTPISMLHKISMFKSNEKSSNYVSNTKENDFKLDKSYHSLNLSKFEDKDHTMDQTKSLKKSATVTKSKIPCIITDKSMLKNDEYNNSSSLNDSIKPKRVIPKYTGLPVLSDLSNSSIRKYPESHIPSKFHK